VIVAWMAFAAMTAFLAKQNLAVQSNAASIARGSELHLSRASG
jgi:hypothetical protein